MLAGFGTIAVHSIRSKRSSRGHFINRNLRGRVLLILHGLTFSFSILVGAITTIDSANGQAAEPQEQSDDVTIDQTKPKPVPDQNNDQEQSQPKSLRIKVIHGKDSLAVEGAKIKVQMWGRKLIVDTNLTTDANGEAKFDYPVDELTGSLNLFVRRDGLVAESVNLGRGISPNTLPGEKTIRLDPGKKIGGKVVDQNEQPVAGAQLSITAPLKDAPRRTYQLFSEKTKDDGSWLLDGAPMTPIGLNLTIEHPRFVKYTRAVQDRIDGVYQLDPGLSVTGRVTDENGKQVPGAHVTVGRDHRGSVQRPIPVEEDGKYTVFALKPDETWVTVEAPKFAAQTVEVKIEANMKPVDFKMKPGHVTRIKIVDHNGEPVSGILVNADTWRGLRPLWWRAKTDAQGEVTWNGAPEDAVQFDIAGPGYMAVRKISLEPQDEPHLVQIRKTFEIEGTVIDEQKSKIPDFHVAVGWDIGRNNTIHWGKTYDVNGRDGKFEVGVGEPVRGIRLRIEAPGYRTWTSEAISMDKSPQKVFVRLERAGDPAGIVLSPDGQPASDARVTLVTLNHFARISNNFDIRDGKQAVASDASGHFAFSKIDEASQIIAVHEAGYAEITTSELTETGKIPLQPWARLGVLILQRRKPLKPRLISIETKLGTQERDHRKNVYELNGTTDGKGRVNFERVVPREVVAAVILEQSRGKVSTRYRERSVRVMLAPGKTAQVVFYGSGAAIVGRLSVKGDPPKQHRWRENEAIWITSKGRGEFEGQVFRCLVDEDGAFRLDDLPPGKYELHVNLTAAEDTDVAGDPARIGEIKKEFEIRKEDSSVDLGTIEGQWSQ